MSYSWLPQTLAEIADVAGLEAALKLAEAKGGQRVFFPPKPTPDSWIIQLLGANAAAAICEYFRGGSNGAEIEIPRGPTGSKARTANQIKSLIDGGATSNEIVERTGVVYRTVTRHRARHRGQKRDRRQGRLF